MNEEGGQGQGRWIQCGITEIINECWRGQMSCRLAGGHVERHQGRIHEIKGTKEKK